MFTPISLNNEDEHLLENVDPDLNLLNSVVPHDSCKYYSVSDFCKLNLDDRNFSLINYNV